MFIFPTLLILRPNTKSGQGPCPVGRVHIALAPSIHLLVLQGGEAIAVASGACMKVVKWVAEVTRKLRDSLDGRNLEIVLQVISNQL